MGRSPAHQKSSSAERRREVDSYDEWSEDDARQGDVARLVQAKADGDDRRKRKRAGLQVTVDDARHDGLAIHQHEFRGRNTLLYQLYAFLA